MRQPAELMAIAVQGAELGVPPMTAINGIHAINGKLYISAALSQSLVLRDLPGAAFTRLDGDGFCEVTLEAPGRKAYTARYTIDEARKAGLVKPGSNWEKYPADMLYTKALMRACRTVAPDCLAGMYAPQECGIDMDGDIIDVAVTQKPVALAAAPALPPPVAITDTASAPPAAEPLPLPPPPPSPAETNGKQTGRLGKPDGITQAQVTCLQTLRK